MLAMSEWFAPNSDARTCSEGRHEYDAMSTLLCNAVRTSLAFLVAPLVVPLICVVIASIEAWSRRVPAEPAPEWLTLVATFSGLYAYLGVIIFGAPIYLALRVYKLTELWIALVVGFVVGAALVFPMFGAVPGLAIGGPLGAIVGAAFWLIDRPDRRTQ